ncbi:MAG TPA: twin-arginine translocation pathway signal [Mycobacterium sp.]|nr:twin-arginine translocation pathway signal [Mycobacterium sp.]
MSADDNTEQPDADAPDLEPGDGVEIDKTTHDPDERQADKTTKLRRPVVAPLVLALLFLVSGALAAWLYVTQYRPDQQTDAAASKSALDAARDGIVALLSYKPETLNQDISAAKSHLTGDFLNFYDQFTRDVVTPAAKEKKLTTSAQVVGAAVSELHPNSAVVLLFVNQATVSQDRPDPAMTASTVLVSLAKVHGKWLISKFDPV